MITYSTTPSLGLLNEENFTTDPTSRGWTVTGSNTFDSNGVKLEAYNLNTSYTYTLENTTTSITKYISFTLYGDSISGTTTSEVYTYLYINNTTIFYFHTFQLGYNRTGNATFTVFKNTPNDWKKNLMGTAMNSSEGGFLYKDFTSVNPNVDKSNKIKIKIVISNDNHNGNRVVHLTNLKWV